MNSQRISIGKAFLAIALSVVICTGTVGSVLVYYKQIREKQRHDPNYEIVAIVQRTADPEPLKTVYFAELLNLSVDHPMNLYAFNTRQAERLLLQSPIIKEARIRKIPPGSISIDYVMRRPIAFIGDYTNTAIDADGVVFPFKQFFTPKVLPVIYLGFEQGQHVQQPLAWGIELKGKESELAFDILEFTTQNCCHEMSFLRSIDVSMAFAPSYGQRQIILGLEERVSKMIGGSPILFIYSHTLRLAPSSYKKQLSNYLVLRNYLRENDHLPSKMPEGSIVKVKEKIIDLRLENQAFIAKD